MFTADAAVGVRPIQIIAGVDFSGNNLKEVGTGGLCNILGLSLIHIYIRYAIREASPEC